MPPPRKTVERARRLRREMSPAEVKLWQHLRTRPDGFKFRHQHPIGYYSLDFYCASARLAIEVDGVAHDMGDNPQRDERRDAWMADHGIMTLRIDANDIFREFDVVVRLILLECSRHR